MRRLVAPLSFRLQLLVSFNAEHSLASRAVQPFDWIDKTFIHKPPPEIKEDA